MSKRIGTAIRCEEQRTSYLNQEYAKLIIVLQQHDIEANDPGKYLNQYCFLFFYFQSACSVQHDDRTKDREENNRTKEKIYSTMAEQSLLAGTLKQIYIE